MDGASSGPVKEPPLKSDVDLESVYKSVCDEFGSVKKVIMQNTQLPFYNDLFYADVSFGSNVGVRALLDSGSMACTLSYGVLPVLVRAGVLQSPALSPVDVVLVGCGGSRTNPLGMCELKMEVYGCNVVVPTLVVEGQCDDLILGSNVLRYLIGQLKTTKGLMKVVFASEQNCTDGNRLISMVANVERWRGGDVPD